MRKALISCFWLAALTTACTLDTRPSLVASGAPGQSCGLLGKACDGGAPSSPTTGTATLADQTQNGQVMTGRGTTDGNVSAGGMSSDMPDASAPPPPPPPPKKPDGEDCGADADCVSEHCLHGICCKGGDCCRSAADCPKTIVDGIQLACNEPSTCQGKGGEVRCEKFLCVAKGDIPNDSACTTQHMAKECKPYKPVFCNGMMEQQEPSCPSSCNSDDACIDGAHCDGVSGTCVMDVDDGGSCGGDTDCVSKHCDRGVCCKSGDCCQNADMCFGYGRFPVCVDVTTCTGTIGVPTCKAGQCVTEEMPSSIACENRVVERCGLYPDVVCHAGVRAPCATSCRVDSQCKADAYCRPTSRGGVCEPKLKDGAVCMSSSQCENSCNHGFCCSDTDPGSYCCGNTDDCAPLNTAQCVGDTNSCDGMRSTATCTTEHRCRVDTRPDPNACTGRTIDCGPGYVAPASCPLGCGCSSVQDCADGYVCMKPGAATRGECQRDSNAGNPNMPPTAGAGAGGQGGGGP